MKLLVSVTIFLSLCVLPEDTKIEWISFEELEDSLAVNSKKVYVDFYTDWCTYCRKMDKEVYTNRDVIDNLNNDYYAVKFDAQTDARIEFGGIEFINDQIDSSRTPIHQIAQILASREDGFVPPAIVILDKDFKVEKRYFQYLDSKSLIKLIKD